MSHQETSPIPYPRTLGIVGGLGPHAHLELERRLLAAVEPVEGDQGYPSWVLASFPGTPDRTAAVLGAGPSPVPALRSSLERLRDAGAAFAVIACNTAHAFLGELVELEVLPILDMVGETVAAGLEAGDLEALGVLATTGTLRAEVYPKAAARLDPSLRVLSLHDVPGGEALQESLVMDSIYGRPEGGHRVGGIKAGHEADPISGRPYCEALAEAAERLRAAGAQRIVCGCTEISLVLQEEDSGIPLLDPLDIAVRETLRIARGERDLPVLGSGP